MVIIIGFFAFVTIVVYVLSRAMGYYFGYELGGLGYFGVAAIISGIMSFISYYNSDKIVLAISGARPADKNRDRIFYSVTENLALGAGLPMPKLYVINDTATNAFATGRDPEHAVVCATTGLLDKLNRTQLEGVVAHELSHIRNYDIRLMTIVSVMVGVIALLADWFLRMSYFGGRGSDDSDSKSGQMQAIFIALGFLFAILSPFIAQLIQLAISRRREFMADASAVAITRQPEGLIQALQIISNDHEPLEAANKATAHLYIANPFKDKAKSAVGLFAGLFNTHPPVELRIKALQEMA